jgi:hypothetical protein
MKSDGRLIRPRSSARLSMTTDLSDFYGRPDDTSRVVDATSYYNQPEPYEGNRRERRAKAAQKRRKKK